MTKKMYWSLCVASIVAVVLTAALTLWSVYGLLLKQAEKDLVDDFKLVAQSITFTRPDEINYLGSLNIKFDSFRVTLVKRDGTVLFDSDNNYNRMENHMGRPEISDAFSKGSGRDIRRSETMGINTYYYAAQMDQDTVLRVSKQTRSIGAVFTSMIPLMVLIVLLILCSSVALASRLTRRLLRPIEQLSENLDGYQELQGYEELEPFFKKIQEQKRLIGEQMGHLREERDTITTITSNMREGLILLNRDRHVLSINPSALKLLDAPQADYTGKSLLLVSRSSELTACVEKALNGEGADTVLSNGEESCQLFANPVNGDTGEPVGVLLLIVDVTEQQKAEKIRRDFTANVSHELKTPLTSISGFAEMIESGMVGEETDMKKFAGRIYKEASRLITLTDDIIRLSRIEEGGGIDLEPVDLRAVCASAGETLRFAAAQKEVEIGITGEKAVVIGNPRMLDELVYNLMDNAIKYNRPGGRVDLAVRNEEQNVVLTVADTGIGIPKEHQERIFERFYRVDKSRSKQTGGTGLGLSIVKHIVERHHGILSLQSAQDVGTTVTIRIPTDQQSGTFPGTF